MALPEWALTDVSRVQNRLGISGQTTLIENAIKEASDEFRQKCNREFFYQNSFEERVSSGGRRRLIINEHRPLKSLTSIEINGESVDLSSVFIEDDEAGIISRKRSSGPFESTTASVERLNTYPDYNELTAKVKYEGGYLTPVQDNNNVGTRDLPYDIERAIIDHVTLIIEMRATNPAVDKISMDDGSISYKDGQRLPESFISAVDRYKDISRHV